MALGGKELDGIVETVRRRGNQALADDLRRGRFLLVRVGARGIRLAAGGLVNALEGLDPAPYSFGEPWGRLEGDQWSPSLAALVRIGARAREGRVTLSDPGVQFFLYHKDVHRDGIVDRDPKLRPGDTAWVADREGNVVGRGELVAPSARNPAALRPVEDLGWYLREGG